MEKVGDGFGGKTSAYRVPGDALGSLKGKSEIDGAETFQFFVMNPKAITMGELYGEAPTPLGTLGLLPRCLAQVVFPDGIADAGVHARTNPSRLPTQVTANGLH